MNTSEMIYCPYCGAGLHDDFDFCPVCGETIARDDYFKRRKHVDGIIFTNTSVISDKYKCQQRDVLKVFNDFIKSAHKQSICWVLLDTVDYQIDLESWEEHNNLLGDYINQNNYSDLAVMIVGGDDVIPIPGIDDPYKYGEGVIPCDMCYSFDGHYIQDYIDGNQSTLDISSARNTVSRIPLEEGRIRTSISDDLGRYLERSNEYAKGIPVNSVVMSANADWIPASSTMCQHLPLQYQNDDPQLIYNGMYVSPKLMTSDNCTMRIYNKSIENTGMLMFNLHGSDDPDYSGFYSTGEAFSIDCLCRTNAKVFNTVACFGARYPGYERHESMLLSALLENQLLLYTGSLVSVPMYYDYDGGNDARELLLNPGTGSEVFMRLYSLYQFKGLPAGLALLQAKCDYFNMCRHIESDDFSMSTILMFSLYGNPLLFVKERPDVIQSALNNDAIPPKPVKGSGRRYKGITTTKLFTRKGTSSMSVLEQVREAVDDNINAIRATVERDLYNQLGLPSEVLDSINRIEMTLDNGRVEKSYDFRYILPDTKFSSKIDVEIDNSGRIKKIFTTK